MQVVDGQPARFRRAHALHGGVHALVHARGEVAQRQPRDHQDDDEQRGDGQHVGKRAAAELLQRVAQQRADRPAAVMRVSGAGLIGGGQIGQVGRALVGRALRGLRKRQRGDDAGQHPTGAAGAAAVAAGDGQNAGADEHDRQHIGKPAAQPEQQPAQEGPEHARAGHEQIHAEQHAKRDEQHAAGFPLPACALPVGGAGLGRFFL